MNASLMPRGKDELGNDTLLFGERPIRANFELGPRPLLALADVLDACEMPSNKRLHLDIRGRIAFAPFQTNGGPQNLRAVDLDDAYRIAMQGKSKQCRSFRDFLIDVLKRLETGQPINAGPPPRQTASSTPIVPPQGSSILVQQAALLHNIALEVDAQQRRLAATEQRVEAVAEQVARIEGDKIDAETAMKSLPGPTVAAPQKSGVDMTEQRIRFWGAAKGGGGDVFSAAYHRLYEEIRVRLHFDARRRFVKAEHGSVLNVCRVEKPDGMSFDEFHASIYALACELFPLEPKIAL